MDPKLQSQFNSLKNHPSFKPDEAWSKSSKERILRQIKNTLPETKRVFFAERVTQIFCLYLPKRMLLMARPALVTFLAVSLAGSGWIISASASNSLPGDYLWNVKLATEKAQIMVSDQDKKAEMHIDFAKRRLDEAKELQNKPVDPEKEKKLAMAIKTAKKSVESAVKSVDEVIQLSDVKNDTAKVIETAKVVSEKAGEVVEKIKEISQTTQTLETKQELIDTSKLASEAGVKVIVQAAQAVEDKKQEGAVTNLKEESDLKQLVVDKVEKINAMITDAEKQMVETKILVVEAGKNGVTATSSTSAGVNLSVGAEVPAVQTSSSLQLAESALKEMAQKAVEVKETVADAPLSEAVANLKQLNEVTLDALVKVEEVQTAVKTEIIAKTVEAQTPIAGTMINTSTPAILPVTVSTTSQAVAPSGSSLQNN